MSQTNYTPIQLYHSTTATNVPSAGNLADGELAINTADEKLYFKNSAGTVKLLAANVTSVANGGTGATTQQAAMNALAGTQTANRVLRSNGTNTTLSQVALTTDVTGTLPIANGGTGATTQQAAMNALAGTQTANRVLRSNGTNTTLSQVALATDVTGTLPIANGGTGTTSTTFVNLATNVTGTLPVANGGTGTTTLTANNVILGNGTSAVQVVAPGTSGNVLTSDGTTWVSQPISAGGMDLITTLSPANGAATVTASSIPTTYKQLVLVTNNITLSASAIITFQLSANNGSSYISSIELVSNTGAQQSGVADVYQADLTSIKTFTVVRGGSNNSNSGSVLAGYTASLGPINNIRFSVSGTFSGANNRIYIYGIK
jgi:hypothetical protein